MDIVFCCASVDQSNPVLADTLMRASILSKSEGVKSLRILSFREEGRFTVQGLECYGLDYKKKSKIGKLISLYGGVLRLYNSKPFDYLYLYMTPTTALFMKPLTKFLDIKIASWFGHTTYRALTKFSLKYCTDLWFNSNKSMAPFVSKNLHLVGQGVDSKEFYPMKEVKRYDLITVGRITPIKKIEELIDVLRILRDKFDRKLSLAICGDAFISKDVIYKEELLKKVRREKLESQVLFLGNIERVNLPKVLNQSKIFVFKVPGGIGKASLEAMALGLPMVISTPSANDFFGPELSKLFLCEEDNMSFAKAVLKIYDLSQGQYEEVSDKCLNLFLEKYTVEKVFSRISNVMFNTYVSSKSDNTYS